MHPMAYTSYRLLCLLDVFGRGFHRRVRQVAHGAEEVQVGPCLLLQSSAVLDLKQAQLSECKRHVLYLDSTSLCHWYYLVDISKIGLLCPVYTAFVVHGMC